MNNPGAMAMQQQLTDLLKQEIGMLSRLLQSLEQEYVALADRESAQLEKVVQQKLTEITQLENISRQREIMMADMGIEPLALSATLSSFESDNHLAILWQQLARLAQQCRHKNRINGSIVETASRHFREALEILRGMGSGNTSSGGTVYDQHGQTAVPTTSRSLTQA